MSLAALAFAVVSVPSIVPFEPVAFQDVYVRMTIDSCGIETADVFSYREDKRWLSLNVSVGSCATPVQKEVQVRVGAFPAGDYRVEVSYATPTSALVQGAAFSVGTVFLPAPQPIADYTGVWYDLSESGWGLAIDQNPYHQLFAVLYAYDENRRPTWYSLQGGKWTSSTNWTGATVYRTSPSPLKYEAVGTASLDFANGRADLSYTINGARATKPLQLLAGNGGMLTQRITVDSCAWMDTATVDSQADGIHIRYPLKNCLVAGTPLKVDVALGTFPPGTYRIYIHAGMSAAPTESLTLEVPAPPIPFAPVIRPFSEYRGVWLDPADPGWGVALTTARFGVLYTYSADGRPEWLTLQGSSWASGTQWGLEPRTPPVPPFDIYRTMGPPLSSGTFDPGLVTYEKVGTGSIEFTGPYGPARLHYTIDGVAAAKSIAPLQLH